MFTSCGWFLDEISGIETVQCLQYAARAIHLARQFHRDFEPEFVAALEEAPSNVARYRDGRGVWEQLVRPSVVDLDRVLAHHAISLIYGHHGEERRRRVYSFDLETLDQEVRSRGARPPGRRPAARPLAADLGRGRGPVRRRSTTAGSTSTPSSAASPDRPRVLRAFKAELLETYRAGSLADVTEPGRRASSRAGRTGSTTCSATSSGGSSASSSRIGSRTTERSFERLANQDEEVLNRLGQLSYPIPKPLRAAASTYLDLHLRDEIARLVRGEAASLEAIERLCERGRAWGYQPERDLLEKTLAESLLQTLEELRPDADLTDITVARRAAPRRRRAPGTRAGPLAGPEPAPQCVRPADRIAGHGCAAACGLRQARRGPQGQPGPAGLEALRPCSRGLDPGEPVLGDAGDLDE